MMTIRDILLKFNPLEDKYISREFQAYGIYLAEQLNDWKHRALYIRLAKIVPRAILEKALSSVKDSNAKYPARLFMWKMKELRKGYINKDKDIDKRIERLKIIISGKVHGVGFRSWVGRQAYNLGVVGWVRNKPNGEVEVVAEGERSKLDILFSRCKSGSPSSFVEDIKPVWERATGEFRGFSIE